MARWHFCWLEYLVETVRRFPDKFLSPALLYHLLDLFSHPQAWFTSFQHFQHQQNLCFWRTKTLQSLENIFVWKCFKQNIPYDLCSTFVWRDLDKTFKKMFDNFVLPSRVHPWNISQTKTKWWKREILRWGCLKICPESAAPTTQIFIFLVTIFLFFTWQQMKTNIPDMMEIYWRYLAIKSFSLKQRKNFVIFKISFEILDQKYKNLHVLGF